MLESLKEQVEQTVSETQLRPPKLYGFPQISGPTQPMENREQ